MELKTTVNNVDPAAADTDIDIDGSDGHADTTSFPPFSPSPTSPCFLDEHKGLSIEVDNASGQCASGYSSDEEETDMSPLLRFCLERDPWQRASTLCADIV